MKTSFQFISILTIISFSFCAEAQIKVDGLQIVNTADAGSSPDKRNFLLLDNKSNSSNSVVYALFKSGSSNIATTLAQHSNTYYQLPYGYDYADTGVLWNNGPGLILRAGTASISGRIKFETGINGDGTINERMRIDENGNVGVGTKTPRTKLQITNGDVYVENPDKGIILKSPNGSCWRVTIANDGNFVRTSIVCP
jgi:hypothetical protein